MITQMTWKQFLSVTDVRAMGKLFPRELRCSSRICRKCLMEAPELRKKLLPENPV